MDYVLTVTGEEAMIIGEGLQELPIKRALGVLNKLQTQVTEQNAKAAAVAVTESEKSLEPAPKTE